jgi:hypothetical protein
MPNPIEREKIIKNICHELGTWQQEDINKLSKHVQWFKNIEAQVPSIYQLAEYLAAERKLI